LEVWFFNGSASICVLVPFVSAGIVYARRHRLREIVAAPSSWGVCLTALAVTTVALVSAIGDHPSVIALIAVAVLPVAIAGIVVAMWGTTKLRPLLFPLLFLLLMMPVPPSSAIDLPLQLASARVSESVLRAFGVPVARLGTLLVMGEKQTLAVAPECDGVRSASAMLVLATLYAYLLEGSFSRRLLLAGLGVPFAYVGNIVRISFEASAIWLVPHWIEPRISSFDFWVGLVVFLIPMALLFGAAGALGCRRFRKMG